jgi:hypothetical protein
MDVLFITATVSIILITILVVAILVYVFRVARVMMGIALKLKQESNEILNDVEKLRASLKQGSIIGPVWGFLSKIVKSRRATKK